jgi:transcriptional regulator with XRE-family HTH domain
LGEAHARLGARVREIREEQHKTQEAVAERAGLSAKFIGEVERGRANASVDTLEKLAHGLGVQVGDLFPVLGAPYPQHVRDAPLVRELAASLESILARLNRPKREPVPRQRSKKR